MITFKYLKQVIIVTLLTLTSSGYAQGGWDMIYLPVSSVDSLLIGKEVRLDFKCGSKDVVEGNINRLAIRKLLFKSDTVTLKVAGKKRKFVESWRFYPDHGILKDQTLKEIGKNCYIQQLLIKSISRKFITLTGGTYDLTTKTLINNHTFVVKKSMIKGVLYKNN